MHLMNGVRTKPLPEQWQQQRPTTTEKNINNDNYDNNNDDDAILASLSMLHFTGGHPHYLKKIGTYHTNLPYKGRNPSNFTKITTLALNYHP
jgi:hypothetical protein